MLAVILKILNILGILLLIILAAALLVLMLLLFFPIVYRVHVSKNDTDTAVNVRVRWLFGFLRINYSYPQNRNVMIKVLWKTIFDSASGSKKKEGSHSIIKQTSDEPMSKEESASNPETTDNRQETDSLEDAFDVQEETTDNDKKNLIDKLFIKYEKIKYTIQQLCDKIKDVWNNITFYKKLVQDEQTKILISSVVKHFGRLVRHIRPGKLKADVVFGTGSPDTTGYAYAVYGMFSPVLGKNVYITPDFTQAILLGEVYAAGHITVFTILVHGLAVLLDRRMHILIRRLKSHTAGQNKPE